ncbi:MAG: hypothetical protein JSR35_04265, partial [Proteobacteria bacterium]|nr:hypothetical protein [Pseudomonadota bacterium]
TGNPDLFEFTGNRPTFDDWMAARHPLIAYGWLDQFAVSFADPACRQSFDNDLGQRVLRSAHLRGMEPRSGSRLRTVWINRPPPSPTPAT